MVGMEIEKRERPKTPRKKDTKKVEGALEEYFERGQASSDASQAEKIYKDIINDNPPKDDGEDVVRIKEQSIIGKLIVLLESTSKAALVLRKIVLIKKASHLLFLSL